MTQLTIEDILKYGTKSEIKLLTEGDNVYDFINQNEDELKKYIYKWSGGYEVESKNELLDWVMSVPQLMNWARNGSMPSEYEVEK